MKYTVTYKPSAEGELADIWTNAADRQSIADAANRADQLLRGDPRSQGESRSDEIRIMFEAPLALQFEIHEDDCWVEVLKVWSIGVQQ